MTCEDHQLLVSHFLGRPIFSQLDDLVLSCIYFFRLNFACLSNINKLTKELLKAKNFTPFVIFANSRNQSKAKTNIQTKYIADK